MSGWILMGLPGALYVSGLANAWIVIGLVLGAYLNYLIVAPRLRVQTEDAGNALTISSFLENRFGDESHVLRWVSGIFILIFFMIYTTSGLVAGGSRVAPAVLGADRRERVGPRPAGAFRCRRALVPSGQPP